MPADLDAEKRLAAETAALLVDDGMAVGLGTGSTVAHLLPALAARDLDIHCVATSPETERAARELGLWVEEFGPPGGVDRLDIAIDGADQVSPDLWLVKGGGGAHVREKIVAAASERFIVIADSSKTVERIAAPVPLELERFGLAATMRQLEEAEVRDAPPSPDGGVIADYLGAVEDPVELARQFEAVPGVVGHGLFPPEMVTGVLVARGPRIERLGDL